LVETEIFSEHNAKVLPVISSLLPRNSQKTEMISLSYDVNNHVYSKSKLSNFVRI